MEGYEYFCPLPMQLARIIRKSPKEIAETIVREWNQPDIRNMSSAEISHLNEQAFIATTNMPFGRDKKDKHYEVNLYSMEAIKNVPGQFFIFFKDRNKWTKY